MNYHDAAYITGHGPSPWKHGPNPTLPDGQWLKMKDNQAVWLTAVMAAVKESGVDFDAYDLKVWECTRPEDTYIVTDGMRSVIVSQGELGAWSGDWYWLDTGEVTPIIGRRASTRQQWEADNWSEIPEIGRLTK